MREQKKNLKLNKNFQESINPKGDAHFETYTESNMVFHFDSANEIQKK